MTKQNELTANMAMDRRAQSTGWTVGKNFNTRKQTKVEKRITFTEYLKKRGIIAFKQSAKSV